MTEEKCPLERVCIATRQQEKLIEKLEAKACDFIANNHLSHPVGPIVVKLGERVMMYRFSLGMDGYIANRLRLVIERANIVEFTSEAVAGGSVIIGAPRTPVPTQMGWDIVLGVQEKEMVLKVVLGDSKLMTAEEMN